MDTERTEEYLEEIYKEQSKGAPAATSLLAKNLNVSPPAVTDMLKHLELKGLVHYKPNEGVSLTDTGIGKALGVIRRHRLWERFLTDVLGMTWDKVHEEACKLEHVASSEVTEKLAAILGDAATCPHGHSIPDKDGNIKEEKMVPLADFPLSRRACIMAVAIEDAKLLKKIEGLGLKPPVIVTVKNIKNDGALEMEVGNKTIKVNQELAKVLLAQPFSRQTKKENKELPLSKLVPGSSGILKSYTGEQELRGRCLSLGFTPGSVVKMIENYNGCPVLVKVHDTEVALGRELAEKMTVSGETE
ncbi:MAG TPA: iron dependent repressor, metal binding and dimerization domain protein [Dehalococcoidales bacterium]|nr:iron dependent repressor, metal binding and dimerization domain protein [Dehalococcoidales bacterium]